MDADDGASVRSVPQCLVGRTSLEVVAVGRTLEILLYIEDCCLDLGLCKGG